MRHRSSPAIAYRKGKGNFLFDCGEDTQRQLLRQALVRPGKIDRIFITRRSAETCFGLPGGPQSFPQSHFSRVRLCLRVPSSDSSYMTPSCCCGRRS